MGRIVYVAGGEGGFFTRDYKLDASCVSGAVAVRSTSTSSAGEVVDASTTDFSRAVGLYAETATYTAAPVAGNENTIPRLTGLEGMARIICHPFAIAEFRVAGGATVGLALATTSPANVLTNSTADATMLIVADANVGTISMAGGLIKGRTGANKGQLRRIITHNNNTDTRVEVAFTNAIAAGDTFIRIPWSKAALNMQLTTDLTEANGIIATGTGGRVVFMRLLIGVDDSYPAKDTALVQVMFGDHLFNSIT